VLCGEHLKLTLGQILLIRLLRLEDSLRGSRQVGSAAAWLAAIGSQADVHWMTKAHGLRTTLRQEGDQILLALGICQQLQPVPIHQDSVNFAGVICQSHCGQDGYLFIPNRLAVVTLMTFAMPGGHINLRRAILAGRVDGIPQDACDPNAVQLHFDDILLCLTTDNDKERENTTSNQQRKTPSHTDSTCSLQASSAQHSGL
jgi:hypothetical protein